MASSPVVAPSTGGATTQPAVNRAVLANATTAVVHAATADELKAELIRLSKDKLAALGLVAQPQQGWLSTSLRFHTGARFGVVVLWPSNSGRPSMPLRFSLQPQGPDGTSNGKPGEALLSLRLHQQVLVMRSAVKPGNPVACADMDVVERAVDTVPAHAREVLCHTHLPLVARRSLGRGALVLAADLGPPLPVAAYSEVKLRVRVGGITVERLGQSMDNANHGDAAAVRIAGTSQVVRGVVVQAGVVEVQGDGK
jgi:flagella basal body P-ring formation protein FlgA